MFIVGGAAATLVVLSANFGPNFQGPFCLSPGLYKFHKAAQRLPYAPGRKDKGSPMPFRLTSQEALVPIDVVVMLGDLQ